jgi:hypothetical protein
VVTGVLAAGAPALLWTARRPLSEQARERLALVALGFDTVVLCAYVIVYAFEAGTPTRQLVFLAVVEGAVRYGLQGAVATSLATIPALVGFELLRGRYNLPTGFRWDYVTFQLGVEVIFGLIVGWLVRVLNAERSLAVVRAREAEALRDELGHRADLLDAANRCARALSSSLDLEEAYGAFIRELAGLLPFERVAIIAVEGSDALTLASAGRGDEVVFPTGWRESAEGTLVAEVVATARTIHRPDMQPVRYPEDEKLLTLGLRSEVAAPVYSGLRPLGMLVVSRLEPDAFTAAEVELVTLLGRLVGSAVQNIRAYDAERATVEELRRLSALRADFVSLVSHELRSPMAAVIGSARTLQQRWRELSPDQRESFLALIADETNRLATSSTPRGSRRAPSRTASATSTSPSCSATPSRPPRSARTRFRSSCTCASRCRTCAPTRRGCARSSPTCSTTPSSTRPPAARSRCARAPPATAWSSPSATRARGSSASTSS